MDAPPVGTPSPAARPPHRTPSPTGRTAVSSAFLRLVAAGDLEQVASAVKERPSLACERDYYGNTALHLAVFSKGLPMVQLLLGCEGTDMDAQERLHKRSACHIAASSGMSDVLAALIARGASFEARNDRNETPAHKAAKHGRFDCLELLVSSGAKLDAQDELGRTPLMRACEAGSLECTKLLIVGRSKLDQLDSFGRSAVHISALRGKLLCLRILLQHGADPFRVDQSQRNAAQLARSGGYEECALELEQFCASLKTNRRLSAQQREKPTRSIEDWTVFECSAWARAEGLGAAVCEAFEKHDVCGRVLLGVTDQVLQDEMGVSSWGARKKAVDAIEKLNREWKEQQDKAKKGPQLIGRALEGNKVIVYEELVMGELLGVGNFAEVRRANWRGTDVAVKVIYRKTLFHDKDHLQLFQQEVDIISQLHHPNIVQFIGTCQSVPEGNFCLVTEFCGGGSLRHLIAENSSALLRDNLRNRIARDVCRAMVHLHKWKPPILHRDLTSNNLLLDHALTCKLADFGLSRESFRDQTMTGGFGAVAWMDPVVLKGAGAYTTASDVFSFGMCCFEMAAMQVPHHGYTQLRFAELLGRGHRPRIPASSPPEWNALITQCWSSDPSQRPTFVELLSRIEAMPAQPDVKRSPSPTAHRSPTPVPAAAAAAELANDPDPSESLLGRQADAQGYIN